MQALDVDWLAVVFDGSNNAIDVAADFLLITVFGDIIAFLVLESPIIFRISFIIFELIISNHFGYG